MLPGNERDLTRAMQSVAESLRTLAKHAPATVATLEMIAANILTAEKGRARADYPRRDDQDVWALLTALNDYLSDDENPSRDTLDALKRVAPGLYEQTDWDDLLADGADDDDLNNTPYRDATDLARQPITGGNAAIFDIPLAAQVLDTHDTWAARDPLVLAGHVRPPYYGVCWNCKSPLGGVHAPGCVNGPLALHPDDTEENDPIKAAVIASGVVNPDQITTRLSEEVCRFCWKGLGEDHNIGCPYLLTVGPS